MRYALILVFLFVTSGCEQPTPTGEPDAIVSNGKVVVPGSKSDQKKVPNAERGLPEIQGKAVVDIFPAKCMSVVNGDTILVLDDNADSLKIRLDSVDAPELGQPFAKQAKQKLSELVEKQSVTVFKTSENSDGLTLAFIRIPESKTQLNETMVREGFAWHAVNDSNSEELAKFEKQAREAKKGLWAEDGEDDQVPPWEWGKR